VRIVSAALFSGLVGLALSGCGRVAHRGAAAPPPALAAADHPQVAGAACATGASSVSTAVKYPVSALIACGPKLEKRDQATGPVTLGKHDTVVYRSALSGEMVEMKGQCEVKFIPTDLARSER
jgi:hypothetical protein